MDDKKTFIFDFLNRHPLATIATVSAEGKPEAAIIGIGQTKDLEIIFGTDTTSRKYTNIQNGSTVAFAVGGDGPETIQYEGTVRELSPDDIQLVKDNYWAKVPEAERKHNTPTNRYFLVTPTWIRHTKLGPRPWQTFELTAF